jgi:hypothetical protein
MLKNFPAPGSCGARQAAGRFEPPHKPAAIAALALPRGYDLDAVSTPMVTAISPREGSVAKVKVCSTASGITDKDGACIRCSKV